ncbi:hypothetical protein [Streptomyces meridianus]|uniref:Uncharacterized protein n=1 Tax=Streptomyces meridianus TaxID=2938945 RepID=A0ABT0XCW2_9ACTN|nr:hypothetical protein [Streptomyces meridianus]MCM2580363.1 hypothetical protein [Streptomyces meridianus]
MPTPYGSRGAMAFSADELRILRRALALALRPHPAAPPSVPAPAGPGSGRTGRAQEVQELLALTESLDEAVREAGRLRAFLLADLARYRAALPGAATGYLDRLEEALAEGCIPGPEDLAALRALSAAPVGSREAECRAVLLRRCEELAEKCVRERLAQRARECDSEPEATLARLLPSPSPEGCAARLTALPGGRAAEEKPAEPSRQPREKPGPKPAPGGSPGHGPGRPVPTPAEVFPPRRRSVPDRPAGPEERAVG